MSSGDWLVEDGGDILLPVPLGGGEHQQFVLNGLEGVGGDGGGVGGGVGGGGGVSGGPCQKSEKKINVGMKRFF